MPLNDAEILTRIAEVDVDVKDYAPIVLGNSMELGQEPLSSTGRTELEIGDPPKRLPFDVHEGVPRSSDPGEPLEWTLSRGPRSEEVRISGGGFKNAFGLFGAPGSGKTHLLKIMVRQVLGSHEDHPERRFGALILDPKAELIRYVVETARLLGRSDDVVVLNTQLINDGTFDRVNVIDSSMNAHELAENLVLAARSAGSEATEGFWFQEWSNLFASTITVLRLWNEHDAAIRRAALKRESADRDPGVRAVTLRDLLDAIFEEEKAELEWLAEPRALRLARQLCAQELPKAQAREAAIAKGELERFFNQRGERDYSGTVKAFITKAYGMFRQPSQECYSHWVFHTADSMPFYESILAEGKIVLVSVSPQEPAFAKTLCTLTKCLFQRAVLARGELIRSGKLKVNRPVLLACDEYSVIASEVPGQPMGDGQFLALARQYGCMAILATQSVHVLAASSLRDTWRSVFSNFAAKIHMRAADNETAEEAERLGGESDAWSRSRSRGYAGGDRTGGISESLIQRKNVPAEVLTHHLKRGQAAVVGTLDGGSTRPRNVFIEVPFPYLGVGA